MTQRKLIADEVKKLSSAYRELGFIRDLVGDKPMTINDVCVLLASMILNGTTDGKPPTPVERVPTAADIGKPVKVRRILAERWTEGCDLVGFEKSGFFVVQSPVTDIITSWQFCIIDEEAGE